MGFTYSRWDGSQSLGDSDTDSLLAALSDDLIGGGDLEGVLRKAAQRGLDLPDGSHLPGLQELAHLAARQRELLLAQAHPESTSPDAGSRAENDADSGQPAVAARADQRREGSADAATADRGRGAESAGDRRRTRSMNYELAAALSSGADSTWNQGAGSSAEGQNSGPENWLATRTASTVSEGRNVVSREWGTAPGESPLNDLLSSLASIELALDRAGKDGDVSRLDVELIRRALGEDAAHAVERLTGCRALLEDAGVAYRIGEGVELSPAGVRRIGEIALQHIFRRLNIGRDGEHPVPGSGAGIGLSELSRPPQFGDPFILDLQRTLMNAVVRRGTGTPITLALSDFEVVRPEQATRSATVLMLDTSRSMPARGYFVAALRVALALSALIRLQFPRDYLSVLAFSEFARVIHPEMLHHIHHCDRIQGTNMQHGFMMARRLLGRFREGSRQIILITDGEPTAHVHHGAVQFAYPPSTQTFEATLREAKRCKREGITINTFMLARSQPLAEFVMRLTAINRGRALFANPETLGELVVGEYLAGKVMRA